MDNLKTIDLGHKNTSLKCNEIQNHEKQWKNKCGTFRFHVIPSLLFMILYFISFHFHISVYVCLAVLSLHCCKCYSLVAVHELLTAVVFLVMEHRLQAVGFSSWSTWSSTSAVVDSRIQSTGLIVVAHEFICSAACEIFPDQGLNPCLLHWQAYTLPLNHQGSLLYSIIILEMLCKWARQPYLCDKHGLCEATFPNLGLCTC